MRERFAIAIDATADSSPSAAQRGIGFAVVSARTLNCDHGQLPFLTFR